MKKKEVPDQSLIPQRRVGGGGGGGGSSGKERRARRGEETRSLQQCIWLAVEFPNVVWRAPSILKYVYPVQKVLIWIKITTYPQAITKEYKSLLTVLEDCTQWCRQVS